jgi:hypothetical protein
VNVTVFDNSVLGKTPSSVIHFLRSDVIGALGQTLDQVQINSLSIGFDYEPSFSFEGGTVNLLATLGGWQARRASAFAAYAQRIVPAVLMQVFHRQGCDFGPPKSYLQPHGQDGPVS